MKNVPDVIECTKTSNDSRHTCKVMALETEVRLKYIMKEIETEYISIEDQKETKNPSIMTGRSSDC